MKQFIHTPKHLKTHRILPGHGTGSRFTHTAPLPGVDRAERIARRSVWTTYRAEQRFQYGVGGSAGLIGAALVLIIMVAAAMAPRTNVLDTTAEATPVEVVQSVDAAPTADADVVALEG
jgi:hypothetical protein